MVSVLVRVYLGLGSMAYPFMLIFPERYGLNEKSRIKFSISVSIRTN